jgi:hypothetical protein
MMLIALFVALSVFPNVFGMKEKKIEKVSMMMSSASDQGKMR